MVVLTTVEAWAERHGKRAIVVTIAFSSFSWKAFVSGCRGGSCNGEWNWSAWCVIADVESSWASTCDSKMFSANDISVVESDDG